MQYRLSLPVFPSSAVRPRHARNRNADIGIRCKNPAGCHLFCRLFTDRTVFSECGFADVKLFPLRFIGIGDEALAEYLGSARYIDKTPCQQSSGAGFRRRDSQVVFCEQPDYNIFQRLVFIGSINCVAETFFNLFYNGFKIFFASSSVSALAVTRI